MLVSFKDTNARKEVKFWREINITKVHFLWCRRTNLLTDYKGPAKSYGERQESGR